MREKGKVGRWAGGAGTRGEWQLVGPDERESRKETQIHVGKVGKERISEKGKGLEERMNR